MIRTRERGDTYGFVYLRLCFFGELVIVVARGGAVGWETALCTCCHHCGFMYVVVKKGVDCEAGLKWLCARVVMRPGLWFLCSPAESGVSLGRALKCLYRKSMLHVHSLTNSGTLLA